MSDSAPWYAEGLSFTCTQCGNCCTGPSGFVWFDESEAEAMAAYLGLSLAEFKRRYTTQRQGAASLGEVKSERGYDCVFLEWDEQGKALCSIYPVRPTQCRTWPFWPSNLKSRRAWERAARTCPGMKRGDGDYYPPEQIRIIRESNPEGL